MLGVDFKVKTIRINERNVAVQLWDTAGKSYDPPILLEGNRINIFDEQLMK